MTYDSEVQEYKCSCWIVYSKQQLNLILTYAPPGPPLKETKRTSNLETNLGALERYSNYSVTLLAFNGAGDGSSAQPVYCTTKEDGQDMQKISLALLRPCLGLSPSL